MKKFLVLYRSTVTAEQQMASATPEQAKAGMDAWMAWAQSAAGAVVDMGAPLGAGAAIGASNAFGEISGYSIVQAETQEAAKAVFAKHPHLMMPGGTIEVREFLPLPGM